MAPILVILARAFSAGPGTYVANILHAETLHAIGLTLLTVAIVLPLNVLFGLAAAWAITKFRFRGKRLLTAVIEVPFSISPIVAGTIYLFLYGSQGLLGPWLAAHDLQVMFSFPAIVLVSLFVTSPFVARELITLMQSQGTDEEEAGLTLGASGMQIFWRITLPNIRWDCSTAPSSAPPAPWASSVRSRSSRATFAARPTPCAPDRAALQRLQRRRRVRGATAYALALVTVAAKAWLEWHVRGPQKV